MKKVIKKGKSLDSKIDALAVAVARGFDGVDKRFEAVDKRFDKVEKDITELKEGNKEIRKDILNLGDRFVSYHAFDALARRVKNLEKR